MLRPAPTQGPYGRDFEAYYAAGATWNAGGDAWSRDVWRTERTVGGVDPSRDELLPYAGPAAALPLFGALARLPFPVAERLWSGLLAGSAALLAVAALLLARRARVALLAPALLLCFASGPLISGLALAQAALVACAAAAVALLLLERTVAGGALALLSAAIQPNIALALAARLRDRRALVAALLAFAAFAALTLRAGGGPAGVAAYARHLGEHGRAERFSAIQHTPAAIAWALGAPPELAVMLAELLAVAVLAALAVACLRGVLDARAGALVGFAALPLAVPFFHEHDFALLLVPLAVLATREPGTARTLAALALPCIAVDWFGLAQRPGGAAQLAAIALAACAGFALLAPLRALTWRDALPAACAAALFAFAVPLARAHPAPTWPDALPLHYRAPAAADASEVWGDEQRAAGLTQRVPQWGALRAIPLAGSVLLCLALLQDARCRRCGNRRTAS